MARFLLAIALTLPVAAALAVPALAQQQLSPPGLYDERLPPIMYDDDDNTPARRAPRGGQSQRQSPNRAFPYPDDPTAAPPPAGLFGSPAGYGHQLDAQESPQPMAPQSV